MKIKDYDKRIDRARLLLNLMYTAKGKFCFLRPNIISLEVKFNDGLLASHSDVISEDMHAESISSPQVSSIFRGFGSSVKKHEKHF